MNQEVLPCFSPSAAPLVIGDVYEHYKGPRYKVLSIARHSETLEEMVIYQALYGKNDVWARPLNMFLEAITVNGILQPRFKQVE